jgi:glyoxylase-like metal-dependent hydrolase (beta-lactamase superfamily II)
VAVVDPAWDATTILREADRLEAKITHILCTHSHFDHVDQVGALLDKIDVPVHMLKTEIDFSGFRCENLRASRSGDTLQLGSGWEIRMVGTPGHTPGSVSYAIPGGMVTGDTLFINGCGRCDFVGGDPATMFETLKMLKTTLPPQTRLYPGHNYGPTPTATLSEQTTSNPYLLHTTLDAFTKHRMEGKTPNTTLPPRPDFTPEL